MAIYLDHAASSPLRPEAAEALAVYACASYAGANPNSLHTPGREAARALEGARKEISQLLGGSARPSELIFTSGGTEADNLAVIGLSEAVRMQRGARDAVVISAIEHEAVLACAPELRRRGFEVRIAASSCRGIIEPAALESTLDERCALVSIMTANNETGMVQPIAELAAAAHAHGALFHTDAVQAFTRIPLSAGPVDALSISAHKVGGPVGIGALYLKTGIRLQPLLHGGGQERGLRPGTQNVSGALAFAAAAQASACAHRVHADALRVRSSMLVEKLVLADLGICPTVDAAYDGGRLPGTVHIAVSGIEAGAVLLRLDAAGFAISSGSACSAGSRDSSHVLSAMGVPRERSLGALRISFDERVSDSELSAFADALIGCVGSLRR
ncbi:cysteine desulfurase [Coriobacteriales bacterium OH1046]|nr:cysteine desulfurase [Coriobacteriales bacterium OH1046]